MAVARRVSLSAICVVAAVGLLGCGENPGLPAGAALGRGGQYDYSPTAIQSGNSLLFWWCGEGVSPEDGSRHSDVILFESLNTATHAAEGPRTVLGGSPGTWDSAFLCNPKIIGGSFQNPLGDGQTYSYALYYVATASLAGTGNSIGVAFSTDGVHWKKYPQPIVPSTSESGYGVGQPAVYNSDGKQAIWLFYEDTNPVTHQVLTKSVDGIHFLPVGTLTIAGLDPDNPSPTWGDMAYDLKTSYWYAAYNQPVRDPSTTGGTLERGQFGIQLYRIPTASLISGATPWQLVTNIDTNLTGNEENFLAGFLRDPYGNLNTGPYPIIQMYTSISNPKPSWDASPASAGNSAKSDQWDIGLAQWNPATATLALNRYFNGSVHEVTTGWVDPSGSFKLESTLGHLYPGPQHGANIPFYACKAGSKDYFISINQTCEGAKILGINGYGYSAAVPSLKLVPIYRCSTDHDHFASQDAQCAGGTLQDLVGYVLP